MEVHIKQMPKEITIRRGYKDTKHFIEFPKSKYWLLLLEEELKLFGFEKEILRVDKIV